METELEWILTNSYKADMIAYMSAHPEKFNSLIDLAIMDKQPYSWRASWLLWSCMEKNDSRIKKYIKKVISVLPDRKQNQQRELLIILYKMELSEEIEGLVYNHCIETWKRNNNSNSLRYNAIHLMIKIAKNHPELWQEITLLTQNQYMDTLTPGARKSILKMLESKK